MQPNNVPLRFVLVPLGLFLGLLALPNLLGPRATPEPAVEEVPAAAQDAGQRMEASVAQLAAAYAAVRR
jgi:hypothetical protein